MRAWGMGGVGALRAHGLSGQYGGHNGQNVLDDQWSNYTYIIQFRY